MKMISLGFMILLMGASPAPSSQLGPNDGAVIKRLPSYKGSVYPSFSEFRVQEIRFDDLGELVVVGNKPYDMLINVNYITSVHKYWDNNNKDYSTLLYMQGHEFPILVRQHYKEVSSFIRRSMEGMVR